MTAEKLLKVWDLKLHPKGLSDLEEPTSVRGFPKRVLALEFIGLSFPTLRLLPDFRPAHESSRKAATLVPSLFPRFFSTYLEWHAEHFKMSLTSESKGVLGREHFWLANICIYHFLVLDFSRENDALCCRFSLPKCPVLIKFIHSFTSHSQQ